MMRREMAEFEGFPPGAFTFYDGLEADNSKDYWEANRATYESDVKLPMLQLANHLEDEFSTLRIFRPQRDTRFAADKSPYKTWAGIASTSRAVGGMGYFLRLESSGLRIACGATVMVKDQLERFRDAILHDRHGKEFLKVIEKQSAAGLPVTQGKMPMLQRSPSGYPKEHPRLEYLRWKGAVIVKDYPRGTWMSTPETFDRIGAVWRGAQPLKAWLDAYVGQSEELTPSRGRIAKT
jgi:uncharacterized protein (TIGR02453 family)